MERLRNKYLLLYIVVAILIAILLFPTISEFISNSKKENLFKIPTTPNNRNNQTPIPIEEPLKEDTPRLEFRNNTIYIPLFTGDYLEIPFENIDNENWFLTQLVDLELLSYSTSTLSAYLKGEDEFIVVDVKLKDKINRIPPLGDTYIQRFDLGFGAELISSYVNSSRDGYIIIYSRIYDLVEWVKLLYVFGFDEYQITLRTWVLWTLTLDVNKTVFIGGMKTNLSTIYVVVEQPIYASAFPPEIEGMVESLFWSIVGRPAFSLAMNILLDPEKSTFETYKDVALWIWKNVVRPSGAINVVKREYPGIRPLGICTYPYSYRLADGVSDCSYRGYISAMFITYALGIPTAILDLSYSEQFYKPRAYIIVPSYVDTAPETPDFQLDMNLDLMKEKFIRVDGENISITDIREAEERYSLYILNPLYPNYPYKNRSIYTYTLDLIGLTKYFQGLTDYLKPPWSSLMLQIFRRFVTPTIDLEVSSSNKLSYIIQTRYKTGFHVKYVDTAIVKTPIFDGALLPEIKVLDMNWIEYADRINSQLNKISSKSSVCGEICKVSDFKGLNIEIEEQRISSLESSFEMKRIREIYYVSDEKIIRMYEYAFSGYYEDDDIKITYILRLEEDNLYVRILFHFYNSQKLQEVLESYGSEAILRNIHMILFLQISIEAYIKGTYREAYLHPSWEHFYAFKEPEEFGGHIVVEYEANYQVIDGNIRDYLKSSRGILKVITMIPGFIEDMMRIYLLYS